ncbi:hypothetical protein GE061_002881 [Apolygus lucorum]|uniref:Uncharacterized protein n=1 Tax=Apolygus lucorum TaxID=248454 RepID=A0A8S9X4G8_APOLU|nr:hypothetical protein GE061_002881 [Apolygus lucorum]
MDRATYPDIGVRFRARSLLITPPTVDETGVVHLIEFFLKRERGITRGFRVDPDGDLSASLPRRLPSTQLTFTSGLTSNSHREAKQD